MKGSDLGKADRRFLGDVILRNLGAPNPSVLVGPGLGLDNAVVSVGNGRVMVMTADPLSMIPSVGMEASAWLTVHELASDLATSAVTPQFAVLDFNLPPRTPMRQFERYFRAMSEEFRRLGVSIVGGHTGKYPGCGFTVVGGGVLMGIAGEEEYVTPSMAREGDRVLLTKGAAIETTAVLSRAFPERVKEEVGGRLHAKAEGYLYRCSTVEDSAAAASVGIREEGVTSMHDATEGGVLGGLFELAASCGKRIVVETDKIHVSEESARVCAIFRLDPLVTLSEGALIITCRPHAVEGVRRALGAKGIAGYEVGEVREGGRGKGGGLWLKAKGRAGAEQYTPPAYDPYWAAYTRAVDQGWR